MPRLVQFLSEIFTSEPGDIVCTGTPGGVGEARGQFLKAGDIVKVEIAGLGTVENRIEDMDGPVTIRGSVKEKKQMKG